LQRGDFYLDVKNLHFVAEIVVEPHSGDGDEQAEGGGEKGFTNAFNDHHGAKPFFSNAALKGIKRPMTVPNRPTSGAVEAMVARPLRR
jgi:hypothetical protein